MGQAQLAFIIVFVVSMTALLTGLNLSETDEPTIGSTTVPLVHCEEDEVITWTAPDTLGCVHVDTLYYELGLKRGR